MACLPLYGRLINAWPASRNHWTVTAVHRAHKAVTAGQQYHQEVTIKNTKRRGKLLQ